MKRSIILWVIAVLITVASAVYQRMTGPTYPIRGEITIEGTTVQYTLPTSHAGETNCPIEIPMTDNAMSGMIDWKRYKSSDHWSTEVMKMKDGKLVGELPLQPPAGKIMYRVRLAKGMNTMTINDGNEVIIRFRGDVPWFIIIPHVLCMFLGMLFSTRAGMDFFNQNKDLVKLANWTLLLLICGGFVFGPLVQKFAFNEYWTGWPFGGDLTDNKTAIAVLFWVIAAILIRKTERPAKWAVIAAIVTFIVFLIPHSLLGSEIDYSKVESQPVSSLLRTP